MANAALPAPEHVSFASLDRDAAGAPPPFRVAVAFYPGCVVSLRAGDKWQPGMPAAIHIGALDDWTPAPSCVKLGDRQ